MDVGMWRRRLFGAPSVVALLLLAALALRLPFRSGLLWAWDSVLYARAIDDFHLGSAVLEQRPHAPGYVLYVLAARVAAAAAGDANAGLVTLSVAGGAVAVVAAYALGRLAAGRTGGFAAAAVGLASPLLWHASEISYPYAPLAGLSGALGLAFWWMRAGSMRRVAAVSAAFGLALGLRQDLLLYLGPLWLSILAPRGMRVLAAGTVALLAASLAWIVPSAAAAGGLDRYAGLVASQARYASGADDRSRTLVRNVVLAAGGLWSQLLWLWPLAAAGAWSLWRSRPDLARHLAWWLVPGAASLVAFHTGEPAYTLALAVPLAGLVGAAIARAAAMRIRPIAVGALAVCAGMILLLGATFAVGHGRYSAHAIRRHDTILVRQIALIRGRHDARDTVLLAGANYLHALRYLPEYRSLYVAPRAEGGVGHGLADALHGARTAVLFDDSEPRLRRLAGRIALPDGIDLYVIDLSGRPLADLEELVGPPEVDAVPAVPGPDGSDGPRT